VMAVTKLDKFFDIEASVADAAARTPVA
jgi:hypothetical protein